MLQFSLPPPEQRNYGRTLRRLMTDLQSEEAAPGSELELYVQMLVFQEQKLV